MKRCNSLVLCAGFAVSLPVAHAAPPAHLPATYVMPTEDPELIPYSSFELKHAALQIRGNGVYRLHYDLPVDLTGGDAVRIDVEGAADSDGNVTLNGDLADAVCTPDTAKVVCTLKYHDLPLDAQAQEAFLDRTYAGDASLPARKALTVAFSHEPIGVLTLFPRS